LLLDNKNAVVLGGGGAIGGAVGPRPARDAPAAPLSLADAASQLDVRPVQLAQASGRVTWPRCVGRGGEVLVRRS
jgi:hypothetical protein